MPQRDSLLGPDKLDKLKELAMAAPHGNIVEVGVYGGGSARVLAQIAASRGVTLYLYDTFEGIPHQGPDDPHQVGDFSDGLTFEECLLMFPNSVVIQGIFGPGSYVPSEIGFVHLDVDQEKSYLDSFRILIPHLVPGGMVVCDDYELPGARKAIDSTFKEVIRFPQGQVLVHKEW